MKRNSKGQFIPKETQRELFAITLPDIWTIIRIIITLLIFAPWIYLLIYRVNLKDKIGNVLASLFQEESNGMCNDNSKKGNWDK
jgi:hypothetical protein